jgi:release factor glutamine methyltransferase
MPNIQFLISKYQNKLPRLELELIIAHGINKLREFVFTHPDYKLTDQKYDRIKGLIRRREKGEPIAYLTGHKEFFGLDFIVNKNVLIPRPETEMMVELAVERITHGSQQNSKKMIIDIGTGSGCVLISLIKELQKIPAFNIELSRFVAIDISKRALNIAQKNAKMHSVNRLIKFELGDLLEPILNNSKIKNQKSKIYILANLPYLTPSQIQNSPSIRHEPKLALEAGSDGLKYYKKLFKQINKIALNNKITVFCEIDETQADNFLMLAKASFADTKYNFELKKDFAGHPRMAVIDFI